MVTWPRPYRGSKARGVAAIALFAVMAAVFLSASFGDSAGLPNGVSITASIGYALFDLSGGEVPSEGLLATFEIIDLVLVAALVGAVTLARKEGGSPLSVSSAPDEDTEDAARTDGGDR
jgi:NADH-quinone oxidoreductase subunit J